MLDHIAAPLSRLGRKLKRLRDISSSFYCVWDACVFSFRKYGTSRFRISYQAIARFVGVNRDTAARAMKRFVELGLLIKRKHRLKVEWGDSIASRQDCNTYEFVLPVTEPYCPAVERDQRKKERSCTHRNARASIAAPLSDALQSALTSLGESVRKGASRQDGRTHEKAG